MDTSAFYAQLDRSDRWHKEARLGFESLSQERRALAATNLVVAETQAPVASRLELPLARRWLQALLAINLFFEREEHHRKVLGIPAAQDHAGYSYVDALSFVMIEELGLSTAFSFDSHFAQFGWELYGE